MIYLANIVRLLFSIYIILIFLRVLFAWLRPNMFNPIVRFICSLTDPYLKLFANVRFLRIGAIDFSPILAFYLLYLLQELVYNLILRGRITPALFGSLIIVLLFRFVYFILFIFMAATALRFIFEIVRPKTNNPFITAVYTISEPVVRPIRKALKVQEEGRFDISSFAALVIIILVRYLLLSRILRLIMQLIGRGGL